MPLLFFPALIFLPLLCCRCYFLPLLFFSAAVLLLLPPPPHRCCCCCCFASVVAVAAALLLPLLLYCCCFFIAASVVALLLLLVLLHLLLLLLLYLCCCFFTPAAAAHIVVRNTAFPKNLMWHDPPQDPGDFRFRTERNPKIPGNWWLPTTQRIQYKTPKIPRISGFPAGMPMISKSRDFRGLVPAAVVRKSETGRSAHRFIE